MIKKQCSLPLGHGATQFLETMFNAQTTLLRTRRQLVVIMACRITILFNNLINLFCFILFYFYFIFFYYYLKIKLALFSGGNEVAYLTFTTNGNTTTRDNWFSSEHVTSSSWTDIRSDPVEYEVFSIYGFDAFE